MISICIVNFTKNENAGVDLDQDRLGITQTETSNVAVWATWPKW
jgi:hypothetical protein